MVLHRGELGGELGDDAGQEVDAEGGDAVRLKLEGAGVGAV